MSVPVVEVGVEALPFGLLLFVDLIHLGVLEGELHGLDLGFFGLLNVLGVVGFDL